MLDIECIDDDMIGDELMGKLRFPIRQKLQELPPDARLATWDEDFPLTDVSRSTWKLRSLLAVVFHRCQACGGCRQAFGQPYCWQAKCLCAAP